MSALIALLLLPSVVHAEEAEDDGLEFVVSLPTVDDRVAWQSPGFRMELGYGYGGLWGAQTAPDADAHAALIRPGVRLDGPWSFYTSLAYAVAGGGLSGAAHYSVTLEPVFHLSDAVRLGVGLGYGGIIQNGSGRPDPDAAVREGLVANQTLASSDLALPACVGTGPVALARMEWWIVMGPLSSVGLSFESGWQRTGCEDDTGRREPDTGTAIGRRQWWAHQTWRTSVLFGWR